MTEVRRGRAGRAAAGGDASPGVRGLQPTSPWLLWLVFSLLGLWIYAPALDGAFVSDDQHYIQLNPYLHELSLENLRQILAPRGVLTAMVENYAPVHLLLHALEWQVFGENVTGYHVVNVLLHAFASVLLVAVFRRSGLPAVAAALGGLVFLVHAANVEAVAWMSQLKSPVALALACGALLLHPRWPLGALTLFALALFAKPSALFALPVLIIWTWLGTADGAATDDGVASPRRWAWPAAWCAVFAAFVGVELLAFSQTAGTAPLYYPDAADRLRSSGAIAARYVAMAATTHGLSVFHEPAPVRSWLDPWWLASLVLFVAIGWRIVVVLRARRPESLFWAWAAASYAAVSGVLPLPFPMADRYLYNILPGLLGAVLWIAADVGGALRARRGDVAGLRVERVALVAVLVLAALFAWRSHERARIWQSPFSVMADAERNYPDGSAAQLRAASRAAQRRDGPAVLGHLRTLQARGVLRLETLMYDPTYAFLRDDPGFRAVAEAIADSRLPRLLRNPEPTQLELHAIALAWRAKRDEDRAIDALERALEVGGPLDDRVRVELDELRREQRLRRIRESAGRS